MSHPQSVNCTNCGAPLDIVANRGYFICPHCTTFHFPEQNDEGVRILHGLGDRSCPICHVRLVTASIDGIDVLYCTQCRGILAQPPSFQRMVQRRRGRRQGPAVTPEPIDRSELARQIACPQCARRMDVHPYYGPGNAIIDTCGYCALIWLDHGELTVIVTAPGRNR